MLKTIEITYNGSRVCKVRDTDTITALAKFLNFKYGVAKKRVVDSKHNGFEATVID